MPYKDVSQNCERIFDGNLIASFPFTVEIFSIFNETGIFIWWPKLFAPNLSHLNIQFRYNDTTNPTTFSDKIIGTKARLNEVERWDDIHPKLTSIPAITNVYPEFHDRPRDKRFVPNNFNNFKQFASSSAAASMPLYMNDELKKVDTTKQSDKSEGITEVRVSGQVSGILIPNASFIDVRVLVPVMDTDGELYQDNNYVQWKTVRMKLTSNCLWNWFRFILFLLQISKPSTVSQFKIVETESRSITISSSDRNVTCIDACIFTEFTICHVM